LAVMGGLWWLLVASVALTSDARRSRQFNDGSQDDMMNIKMLGISVPGTPGEDYPIFSAVPQTSFTCADKDEGGYYADMETGCQGYHTCGNREDYNLVKFSSLCPNGTIFDQQQQTCRWWYLVDCQSSDSFYFSQTNIRQSSQVSVSNGGQSSSGNFGATAQIQEEAINAVLIPIPSTLLANLIPQRTSGTQNIQRVQQNGIKNAQRVQQIGSGSDTQNARRVQQINSGSGNRKTQRVQQTSSGSGAQNTRRVQQNDSQSRRSQNNSRSQNNQIIAQRRNSSNARADQTNSAGSRRTQTTGRRTPERRTQQTRNNVINFVDTNRVEERPAQTRPATLPPTSRDFSFSNGRIQF